jgi:hypothetical protein
LRPKSSGSQENQSPRPFERELKRRKLVYTPEGSPERSFLSKKRGVAAGGKARGNSQNLQSSPCERVTRSSAFEKVDEMEIMEEQEEDETDEDEEILPPKPVQRIVPLSDRGLSARLLQLSLGKSIRQHHEYPVNGQYSEWHARISL